MKPCSKFNGETSLGKCSVLGVGVNKDVVCKSCQQHWTGEDPPETSADNPYLKELVRHKTLGDKLGSLASAIVGGVKLASRRELAMRASVCTQCEMLVDSALLMKKCKVCECTMLKLQLEAMRCPLGKW